MLSPLVCHSEEQRSDAPPGSGSAARYCRTFLLGVVLSDDRSQRQLQARLVTLTGVPHAHRPHLQRLEPVSRATSSSDAAADQLTSRRRNLL